MSCHFSKSYKLVEHFVESMIWMNGSNAGEKCLKAILIVWFTKRNPIRAYQPDKDNTMISKHPAV